VFDPFAERGGTCRVCGVTDQAARSTYRASVNPPLAASSRISLVVSREMLTLVDFVIFTLIKGNMMTI
jgi:hypothetical protein